MAETPKKKKKKLSNVNTGASCATILHCYLLGDSKSLGECSRSSSPD